MYRENSPLCTKTCDSIVSRLHSAARLLDAHSPRRLRIQALGEFPSRAVNKDVGIVYLAQKERAPLFVRPNERSARSRRKNGVH